MGVLHVFHIAEAAFNKRTKENFVANIEPEQANMFDANAKLPIAIFLKKTVDLDPNMLTILL